MKASEGVCIAIDEILQALVFINLCSYIHSIPKNGVPRCLQPRKWKRADTFQTLTYSSRTGRANECFENVASAPQPLSVISSLIMHRNVRYNSICCSLSIKHINFPVTVAERHFRNLCLISLPSFLKVGHYIVVLAKRTNDNADRYDQLLP